MTATTLADRAVIRLSGEGVRDFLQGLVTNDIAHVAEGAPVWAGLLTAQGKALFDFLVWGDGDDLLVDCEKGESAALAKRLTLYRLRRKIAIGVDEGFAAHWRTPAQAGVQGGKDDASGSGLRPAPEYGLDPRLAELGHRWLAAPSEGDASAAWRAHRLSLGVTEGIAELGSDKTLWLEANAGELNGVDFTKGCYVGQENTARMHYRNKINRRLVVVPLAQADKKRQRIAYPDLGLSVEHRRVDDMAELALAAWQKAAIAA